MEIILEKQVKFIVTLDDGNPKEETYRVSEADEEIWLLMWMLEDRFQIPVSRDTAIKLLTNGHIYIPIEEEWNNN